MRHSSAVHILASLIFCCGCSKAGVPQAASPDSTAAMPAMETQTEEDTRGPAHMEEASAADATESTPELPPGWLDYRDPAGLFRVALPEKPLVLRRTLRMPFGPQNIAMHTIDRGQSAIFVMTSEYPIEFIQQQGPDLETFLRKAFEAGMATKPGAKLIDRSGVAFDAGLAAEQSFRFPADVNEQGEKYPDTISFQRAYLTTTGEIYMLQLDCAEAYYTVHRDQIDQDRQQLFDSFVIEE